MLLRIRNVLASNQLHSPTKGRLPRKPAFRPSRSPTAAPFLTRPTSVSMICYTWAMSLKEFFRPTGVKLFWTLTLPIIWLASYFIVYDCFEYSGAYCDVLGNLTYYISYPLHYFDFWAYLRWRYVLYSNATFYWVSNLASILLTFLYVYFLICIVAWTYALIKKALSHRG